jgi:hypothetical protein
MNAERIPQEAVEDLDGRLDAGLAPAVLDRVPQGQHQALAVRHGFDCRLLKTADVSELVEIEAEQVAPQGGVAVPGEDLRGQILPGGRVEQPDRVALEVPFDTQPCSVFAPDDRHDTERPARPRPVAVLLCLSFLPAPLLAREPEQSPDQRLVERALARLVHADDEREPPREAVAAPEAPEAPDVELLNPH